MKNDPSADHVPALDGLRGVAILMVLVFHFYGQFYARRGAIPIDAVDRALALGSCGVDLFFVLSGFLITGILVATKRSRRYFLNFYARRSLRIFPLYFGTLVVFLL